MLNLKYMPQHNRFNAILLGFMGGALDVYCHMQFDSLVATQTGNILLLVADWDDSSLSQSILRLLSIFFFSIGFILATIIKKRAKTAYWRTYCILPLLMSSAVLPFFPKVPIFWIILLATTTGILTLTFTDSHIESHAYTILMTSGNYRKMLSSWYQYLTTRDKTPELKRQATNYSLVVSSFVLGAISVSLVNNVLHEKALWLVTLSLACVCYHYTSIVIRYKLKYSNI
ncbi:YoaK family protein [Streptococcus sciuri]|uniref:DUF1275 domain-containing protein n=1 Tax=Streptococcus sciuri TaxID=2973939 RepID=A0ABT2F5U8_9STRE|nr:YoaK family protein [Streptococcus sciuri]MCS4487406.1 DUF1275 domain-containing protein [Streptococcus sciuri]